MAHVTTPAKIKKFSLTLIIVGVLAVALLFSLDMAEPLVAKVALWGFILLGVSFIPKIQYRGSLRIVGILFAISGLYLFYHPELARQIKLPRPEVQAEEQEQTIRIPLLGENVLSEAVVDIDKFPPGFNYFFEGPESAEAHYNDGTRGSITKWFGVKRGKLRFTGPAGQEVTVRFVKQ